MITQDAVEVLRTNQPDRWKEVLEEVGSYDYYHLPQFHKLTEIRGYGEAVMPVFREKGCTMAYDRSHNPNLRYGCGDQESGVCYHCKYELRATIFAREEV